MRALYVLMDIGLMRKNHQNFAYFKPAPSAGLFDRIITAIKREQELRHSRKLLFSFLILLIISFVATPFSWSIFINQLKNSGIIYFVSAVVSDFNVFLAFWREFSLAILESLPITGIIFFGLSMGMALFTLRLFFYKKRLLLNYLIYNYGRK